MDNHDKQAIEGLFHKLAQVEGHRHDRDPEAEHLIAQGIARHPGAPYYLAQTVVVQDHALSAAQARIHELEAELDTARAAAGQSGGVLSRLFGQTPAGVPEMRRPPIPQDAAPAQDGFLGSAAQTAMRVAGGMMLGYGVAGMRCDGNDQPVHGRDGMASTDMAYANARQDQGERWN